jgi:arsenate reductase
MDKPIVLILCTANSCRSQMAEAFLRSYQGDRYDVHSAGIDPAEAVHPLALDVMREVGEDLRGQAPKSLRRYLGREAVRHVIVVCDRAGDACPRIWPGVSSRTYVPFEDPAAFPGHPEAARSKFRDVRDQIDRAMRAWAPPVTGIHPEPRMGHA